MARIDLDARLAGARDQVAVAETALALPGAKFARMARKEARVREDQYVALTGLARALMRRRRASGERITENTLIRIAIDMLLARADDLNGRDEDELRKSVTFAHTESVAAELPNSEGSQLRNFRTLQPPHFDTSRVSLHPPAAAHGAGRPGHRAP